MEGSTRYLVLGVRRPGVSTDVFEGVEERPEGRRRVVIKRVRDPEDRDTIRGFFEECRVLERLSHPNIVRLYDVGIEQDRPFQVFEAVDGWDAQALLDKTAELGRAVPVEIALHITREIALALHYAHELSGLALIHRDVSPDNILLAFDGRVLLSDFGIALFTARSRDTQLGMTKGKLAYMSPEQALAGHLDRRSDLFSLGCVLHALAAGASPLVEAKNRDRLLMQEPLVLSADLDPRVRSIIARAVAPDRRDRPKDALEMASACSEALRDTDGKRLIVELLSELAPDDTPTRIMERLPSQWTLELERSEGELRTFTASGFGAPRDPTSTGETDPQEATEPRAFTNTEPRVRPSVFVSRERRVPWRLLGVVAVIALSSAIGLSQLDPRRPATPLVRRLPSPTPLVVPGPAPVEAPPVIAEPSPPPSPEPDPDPEPRRAKRRPPTPSAEAQMNAALERLVKRLEASANALDAADLGAFEARYLELGTAANRAASAEERLRIARRAEALLMEVERATAGRRPAAVPP